MVLLGAKTNDSVELAVTALKEAGALLQDTEPQMLRMYATSILQVSQALLGLSRHGFLCKKLELPVPAIMSSGFQGLSVRKNEVNVAKTLNSTPSTPSSYQSKPLTLQSVVVLPQRQWCCVVTKQ